MQVLGNSFSMSHVTLCPHLTLKELGSRRNMVRAFCGIAMGLEGEALENWHPENVYGGMVEKVTFIEK